MTLWYMGKVLKMALNAFGDNRNFRVQLYLFTPVSLFLPVQYLARNMLFNRLSVHFAQGVKNFITGWWHVFKRRYRRLSQLRRGGKTGARCAIWRAIRVCHLNGS